MIVAITSGIAAGACRRGDENGRIHASGHIEATEVRVAAKVGGRLAELPFEEGDAVTAGQVVARFDAVDAEHEVARARAELAVAQASLDLLEAGSREEDVRQAEAEVARAEAELAGARLDLDRLEGLTDRGSATEKARDDARTRVEVLDRALAAGRAGLDKLRAGPRREEIAQARARCDALRAAIAGIEQRIADAVVTAPRDGVITRRATEPGEVLPPGALLEVLTDLGHPWLNVYVDEPSLAAINIGHVVEVRVDGTDQVFPGMVSFVSDVAEFTPKNVQTPEERAKLVFRVKVALDNSQGVFKPGMPADAYFQGPGAR